MDGRSLADNLGGEKGSSQSNKKENASDPSCDNCYGHEDGLGWTVMHEYKTFALFQQRCKDFSKQCFIFLMKKEYCTVLLDDYFWLNLDFEILQFLF